MHIHKTRFGCWKLKKGLTVKIHDEEYIKRMHYSNNYRKGLLEVAGKTFKIKRASRSGLLQFRGPLDCFYVDGIDMKIDIHVIEDIL
jgi:hypothetical protein